MKREQAINYLKSSGFSDEQIEAVTEAFSEPIWHQYTQEKPTEIGWYLATLEFEEVEKFVGKIFWWGENNSVWKCCIAWAELPKPYEEGAEE